MKIIRWPLITVFILVALVWKFWQPQGQAPLPTVFAKQNTDIVEALPTPTTAPIELVNEQPIEDKLNEPVDEELVEEDEIPKPEKKPLLCEHIVSGETQFEFTGQIRLINKSKQRIYGWSVEWEYEDGSTLVDASDVALAGNNPYTGEYLNWNAEILPGKTITFAFTGIKNGDAAPLRVNVTGEYCM